MCPPGKTPYIIYRASPGAGFWSNFLTILQGLDDADLQGLVPVVDMERHPTHYNEEDDFMGTRNAWEYYFEQPAGMTLAEALKLDPPHNGGLPKGRFTEAATELPLPAMAARGRELVEKYIRIKPDILARTDAVLAPGLHPDVLGVHVRGTDMRHGYQPNHPVSMSAETYLDQAVALDRDFAFAHVFLACDEEETVEMFRRHFGTRLLTSAAFLSSSQETYAVDYQWLFGGRRPHHRYLLGVEVLVDTLLLARCGHLLCGRSGVSRVSVYFSDAAQQAHIIPAMWFSPPHRSRSVGRSKVAEEPPAPRPCSSSALLSQIAELQRLLETVENLREDALIDRDNEHQKYCETKAALKAALRENSSQEKKYQQALSDIGRLKERIVHLLNWWTRLGWRFMPWTRPHWRTAPLALRDPEKRAPGADGAPTGSSRD